MRKLICSILLILFLTPAIPLNAMGVDIYVNGDYVGRGSSMMNPQMTKAETYVDLFAASRAMNLSASLSGDNLKIGEKLYSASGEGLWDSLVPIRLFIDEYGWYIDPNFKNGVNLIYVGDLNEINVFVNGTKLKFDQPPLISFGRTYVPIRAIFEYLGADVEFQPPNVIARKSNTSLIMYPGKMETLIMKSLDTHAVRYDFLLENPPFIQNGRTLAPLRSVGELMGAKVVWNETTRTITIDGELNEFLPPKGADVGWI